jgi:isopentenyl phosphate kinase
MVLSIVKVGGSVIADRNSEDLFRFETAHRLAKELAPYAGQLILVHGTGVVGKRPAVEEDYVDTGILPGSNPGLSLRVKRSLQRLSDRFAEAFLSAGTPILPLEVASFFELSSEALRADGLKKSLLDVVHAGVIPVFHGDIVARDDNSHAVVSSDMIVLILARSLRPENVFFLTDVDGVFPRDGEGKPASDPLRELGPGDTARMRQLDSDESDVSGGMRAKVQAGLGIAQYAGRVIIANGMREGVAASLLAGREEKIACTRLRAS